jgi:hypothetical protein
MYRQCKFGKDNQITYAWVEEKPGLKIGSVVEIKSLKDEKWTVLEIGGRLTKEYVMELASDYKSQRKASDI